MAVREDAIELIYPPIVCLPLNDAHVHGTAEPLPAD